MALSLGEIEKKDPELGNSLEAEVLLVLDHSGSMEDEYDSGGSGFMQRNSGKSQVDEAVSRSLAVGATLDPDQKAQAIFFDSNVSRANDIDLGNYSDWLKRNRPSRMGSTRLDLAVLETIRLSAEVLGVPAIANNANLKGNWSPVMADRPVLAIIVTDGVPDDSHAARKAFQAASYCPIEFVIMYVSNQHEGIRFVRELNDLDGTFVDNICVVEFLGGMSSVTDEAFADGVLAEFPGWVKAVQGKLLPAA